MPNGHIGREVSFSKLTIARLAAVVLAPDLMTSLTDILKSGEELNAKQVGAAATQLLDGGVADAEKADFLKALAEKGETPGEIAAFVEAFLKKAVKPGMERLKIEAPIIDVCGTGGDKLDLFNVSTTSMFVIAAGGAIVVKHGNRGITSKSGGADVLEALGANIELGPENFRECIKRAGVGFLYAPHYHPAFKAIAPVRQALAKEGRRTIFNLIGPLLNPAKPDCQLVGVMEPALLPSFADILQRLGRESAWVVSGETEDGKAVDEVSAMGRTLICKSGSMQKIEDEEIHPEDFGLSLASTDELKGGDAKENAKILTGVLDGDDMSGRRDIVLMNAAAGLVCAGLADHMDDGIPLAEDIIDSGDARQRLDDFIEASNL